MKLLTLLIVIFLSSNIFSQQPLPKRNLEVVFGRAIDYSGDIPGLIFGTEYTKYFKKKFSWSVSLGGTIHDDEEPLFYTDSFTGRTHDISIRNTTAGVQLMGHAGYSIVRSAHHELQFKLGGLLRYQSTSVPDVENILYPAFTGIPLPVYFFQQMEPQKTYAIGCSLQIDYTYTINNKVNIGIRGGYQFDSNGDNIAETSLSVGRRF